jgi:hypothetical protein
MDTISPEFLTVRAFAARCGMSRRSVYAHLAAGHFQGHLVGSRTLIDVEPALRWIRSQPPPRVLRDGEEPDAPAEGAQRTGAAERARGDRPGLAA